MIPTTGVWPLVFAFLAGAGAAFGQQPYAQPLALLAGFVAAFWLFRTRTTTRQSALFGWVFGTGYFMHALQWIVSPFLVDVARHGWMAPFAVVLLSAGLALFWGLAFGVARWLSPAKSWALILTLPAAEMLRAYVFTGFPWAMPSQATLDVLAGGLLSIGGPYVVTMWLIVISLAISEARRETMPQKGAQVVLAGALATFLIFEPFTPDVPLTDHTIRLVQPNAAQREKWDSDKIPLFFNRQLKFTAAPPKGDAPDLILWSETAIPWQLDYAGTALDQIVAAGGDATVALGAQRRDGLRYFNTMVVLDRVGGISQTYDKHHLVPFGEYIPFGDFLARFGITAFAAQVGNGYASGPGAQLLDFGPLGRALPLICYEAVFPHDANAAAERPDFLIQITNDAWFGKGAGPKQHLAQARMRAIEQGLPLARAANTGISAMIDPYGRVTASLPLNTAGFVDAVLPAPLAPTVYSRTGDLPLAVLLAAGLALAAWRSRRAPDSD